VLQLASRHDQPPVGRESRCQLKQQEVTVTNYERGRFSAAELLVEAANPHYLDLTLRRQVDLDRCRVTTFEVWPSLIGGVPTA
jgi:hypothetical protein